MSDNQNKNEQYRELLTYLTAIMHRLQDQSDVLRSQDIAICLSNDKKHANNAFAYNKSKTIILGLQYLKKMAKQSEDAVAQTIAHELSHIIFKQKYHIHADKEEEIFADNYGLILCHRAGYNVTTKRWTDKLSAEINDDQHPQAQIRNLIMQRTVARLKASDKPLTKFKKTIPNNNKNFVEYYEDVLKQREKDTICHQIYTDLPTPQQDDEPTTDYTYPDDSKIEFLLSLPNLKKDQKFSILHINFDNCSLENICKLYQKVDKSPVLSSDWAVLMQFRKAFIQNSKNFDEDIPFGTIIQKLDDFFIAKIESINNDKDRQEFTKKFLDLHNRFSSPQHRRKIMELYAKNLVLRYGFDDGSEKYGRHLKLELKQIARKIHNADVIPLMQEVRRQIKITPQNLYVIQDFVTKNSFELQQVRAETLITGCLLNPQQALETVKYLTNSELPAFHFCGIYPPSSKKEYSYINATTLSDIRNDWTTVSPSKRTDIFTLLMENISPDDCNKKLALFVDKTTKDDEIYKSVMETYINTYPPQQQPYVVATLVSRKDINRPFSYEDYFKTMLQNSGINGCRVHDKLYGTDLSENIGDIHRNYIPLYDDDNIEFANLQKLGLKLQTNSDDKLKKIGQQILFVTTKTHPLSHNAPKSR